MKYINIYNNNKNYFYCEKFSYAYGYVTIDIRAKIITLEDIWAQGIYKNDVNFMLCK
jgi:hypothetical protein